MAFRLINFITIASFESGKNYFSTGNYKAASGFFRIWTICDPSGKYSWLYLARAEAFDGQTDEAIAAINKSISYGLSRDQIINDKAFEGIRNDKKFIRLIGIIK
jgi:predicted Zn-dependent protease